MPELGRPLWVEGRIVYYNCDHIVGESRNGGWFAIVPVNGKWGADVRTIDGAKGPVSALRALGAEP